jgi:LacI family transcriptional regulator
MARFTIKEIAKIAGVSPSAVSIVLNDRKGVSDKTRTNIRSIVDKLQYSPNPNSRKLLFNKTNNIVVLFKKDLSPMEHLFHSELNSVILHECELLGYDLVFASVMIQNNTVIMPKIIKSYDADGIIFYGDIDPLILSNIKKFEIPYIIVDSHSDKPDELSVRADYRKAAYTAARYLINIGHRKIAYIGADPSRQYGSQTFTGFKKAVEENKLVLPINWIQMEAFDEESSYLCMENILSQPETPTAVCCAADIYAIGAVRCIKKKGMKVPDDVSITGIDDIILSKYIEPSLTTIKLRKEEMGKMAIEMLIRNIKKQDVFNEIICSDDLMIRESTRQI